MDVFTLVLFVVVLALAYLFINGGRWNSNLPPGPRRLPLIGNVLQVAGKDLRQVCKEYRKMYGDIFTLRMFNKTLIVVNGYEAIKDVAVKNGDVFSDRPDFAILAAGIKGEGVVFSSGEVWKNNRRFVIRTLRDFGMGKSKLQPAIHEEISYFLEAIEKEQERPFDIEYLLTMTVSNIMCSVVFGKRFDYRDEEFIDIVRRLGIIFSENLWVKPYWLRFIPGDPFRVEQSIQNFKYHGNYCRTKVREHYQDYDAGDLRDVIDVYIKQMKMGELSDESSLTNEAEIVRIVHELFVAGTETTSTVLRFALVCLLRNPETQEKLADEVRKEVPQHRLPDTDDIRNLPYLQATIAEIIRRASVVTFSLPHATKTDRQYLGYTIPKSASILLNLDSVLLDESLWGEPLDFNPSRFMSENNSQIKREELIAFGTGPRSCPGESMARMELSLFLSAMLQRFKFLPAIDEDPPSLATKLGVTSVPMPFKLRAIKRA